MSDYETIDHDVLVIGAGGAGLRASIEAAANGARVGLVCKALLGKAHTVMAGGGAPPAPRKRGDRDNLRRPLADPMPCGPIINNLGKGGWRLEKHAESIP